VNAALCPVAVNPSDGGVTLIEPGSADGDDDGDADADGDDDGDGDGDADGDDDADGDGDGGGDADGKGKTCDGLVGCGVNVTLPRSHATSIAAATIGASRAPPHEARSNRFIVFISF